jgi:hypothetical protein
MKAQGQFTPHLEVVGTRLVVAITGVAVAVQEIAVRLLTEKVLILFGAVAVVVAQGLAIQVLEA